MPRREERPPLRIVISDPTGGKLQLKFKDKGLTTRASSTRTP